MSLVNSISRFGTRPAKETSVNLKNVVCHHDPEANSKQMKAAKQDEIQNLLRREAFKVVLKEDNLSDASVLPGRFVLAVKSISDGSVKQKAQCAIGGHRDKMKHMIVHSASALQAQNVGLLLALTMLLDFDIWTSDVRQAYLQSCGPLSCQIYNQNTVPEFELQRSQCLQLIKPLCGLAESGEIWHKTLDEHHRTELDMEASRSDPALYLHVKGEVLKRLSGGYIDDIVRAGDSDFLKFAERTKEKFDKVDGQTLPCNFTGFSISRNEDENIVQCHHVYLKKLKKLPLDATYTSFRSMKMKLAWLADTQPDCLFETSQLA